MDWFQTGFTAGLGMVATAGAWIVNRVVVTDKNLAAHLAATDAIHLSFKEAVVELKSEAKDTNNKLDRLIEQSYVRASDALVARGVVSGAAATAIDVVESAKISALAIIAQAASEAKKLI